MVDIDALGRTESDTGLWNTRDTVRTALVAVHTVTALMRLLVVVKLIEADDRIKVVYTRVPDQFGDGVEWWLTALGAKVISWPEATHTRFDLVLAASLHRLEDLHGRRLAMPHGAGYIKQWPTRTNGDGSQPAFQTYGLDADSLVHEGKVVVDRLVLSHVDQVTKLDQQCPQAVRHAVVGGDPSYDRLLVSKPYRDIYRRALSVRDEQTLVVVSSTWGRDSLFGAHKDVLSRLMRELRADQRVVLTLHPAIWAEHGDRQVMEWLRPVRDAGLDVIGPRSDWCGVLVAADLMIGDYSSMSVYGAAIGLPLLLSPFPAHRIDPASVMTELAKCSPQLCPNTVLLPQLQAADRARAQQRTVASKRVSSVAGMSASILRQVMYELLDLPELAGLPRQQRAPDPEVIHDIATYH